MFPLTTVSARHARHLQATQLRRLYLSVLLFDAVDAYRTAFVSWLA
jgi:hypothetical protein